MSENDELTETEIEALHELQLGKENIRKGYGKLLDFHHNIGRGINHFKKASELLDEAEKNEESKKVKDVIPENAIEDYWTWELVDKFEDKMLKHVLDVDSSVRDELADGERHINEKKMEEQRKDMYWDET